MCRTFRKHYCKAPHLVVRTVLGAEVRPSGQQRVLGAKAHGPRTNTRAQRGRSGTVVGSTEPEQNENEIGGQKQLWNKEGLWAVLGAGCLYVLGYLEGLTKAAVVIVLAYNTATLIFFQSQVTETGLNKKEKSYFKNFVLTDDFFFILFWWLLCIL